MQTNFPLLERLREFDENRASLPGEHWAAFGLGLYFLSRRRQTPLRRLVSVAVGTALVARALSGRDGALAVLGARSSRESSRDSASD